MNSKTVLFLCTGNYYRSRFAEVMFNSAAEKMHLPWKATSRGLALERGINNIGPMASVALEMLETRGIRDGEALSRFPIQAADQDFQNADWVVALQEAEHLPLLQERFPTWIERVEFWHVEDRLGVLPLIEREVMDLSARLIMGGKPRPLGPLTILEETEMAPKVTSPKKQTVVKIGRETKGRGGKGVTIISELPLDEEELKALAAKLKAKCGTGGTVKDGRIEIQGDQRDKLSSELEALGYKVKRSGG